MVEVSSVKGTRLGPLSRQAQLAETAAAAAPWPSSSAYEPAILWRASGAHEAAILWHASGAHVAAKLAIQRCCKRYQSEN